MRLCQKWRNGAGARDIELKDGTCTGGDHGGGAGVLQKPHYDGDWVQVPWDLHGLRGAQMRGDPALFYAFAALERTYPRETPTTTSPKRSCPSNTG